MSMAKVVKWIVLLCILHVIFLLYSCEMPSIFNSKSDDFYNPEKMQTIPDIISLKTTGGFAGVNQSANLESNLAHLYGYAKYPEWQCKITDLELQELTNLFLTNEFYHFENEYFSDMVDVFYYEITFSYEGLSKTVNTDYFAAPKKLRTILDELIKLIDDLFNRGPELQLVLNKTTMAIDDTLRMRFLVINPSPNSLALQFNTSQKYDFFIAPRNYQYDQNSLLWSWAHDKAFLQVITTHTMPPSDTLIFEESWYGRSNTGEPATGDVLVSAKLTAFPGGCTPEQIVTITE